MKILKGLFQSSISLLPKDEIALNKIIKDAEPEEYQEIMISYGMPHDIAERVACMDVNNPVEYEAALLSCFGRLQYLQPAGLFVAARMRKILNLPTQSLQHIPKLAIEGAVRQDAIFSAQQSFEIRSFLESCKVFNGHVPEASDGIGRDINYEYTYPYGSYLTSDLVHAPHILEQLLSSKIIVNAEAHLGCPPKLVALQAWWNFPGHENNPVRSSADNAITDFAPKNFHRDLNDFRMFWVYVYLTDVDGESGPHEVIRFSGDFNKVKQRGDKKISNFDPQSFFYQYGYQIPRNQIELVFENEIKTFVGPAGTTFFSNGFNFHRIYYPLRKPRLMMAARFAIGAKKNLGNQTIKASRIRERIINKDIQDYVMRQIFE